MTLAERLGTARTPTGTGDREQATTVEDRLLLLTERLRRAGVSAATTELVDACLAVQVLGIADRELFRSALRSTLVKRADQLSVFDDLFDRTFPLGRIDWAEAASPTGHASETASGHKDSLGDQVLAAIAARDPEMLRALAAQAVDAYGGLERGGSSERQYLTRVMRAMDLAALLQKALRQAGRGNVDEFDAKLTKAEAAQLVEEFRRLLAQEVAMRLAMLLPVETITTVKYPDDVDLLESTHTQRAELRRVVEPLAQRLAARMAQRRQLQRTGRVDVRRTARRALAYGGVPVDPAFRTKRASRPDLIVLCDVSGSVAEFAHFMLSLVHALNEQLQRLRTFVFVDGVADVTTLFADAVHELVPMHLLSQPGVVRGDGHSDYGSVFVDFLRVHEHRLRSSTTVIITGDARSNYRDAHADALRRIAERVQSVYWLNPEPSTQWDTTDSVIGAYRPNCRGVFEVRSTRQLAEAVLEIVNDRR